MKIKKILWGLFFIFAAAFAIISPLGGFTDIGAWSIIFTILSVGLLFDGIANFSYFKILMSLAFLSIIYSTQLGIEQLTPWPVLGAAILLSIGLSILFGRSKPRFTFYNFGSKNYQYNHKYHENYAAEHYEDNDNVQCSVVLSTSSKYLRSTNLKSAHLSCNLGELNVFFDNVTIHPDGAEITVDCNLGDINLYIPKEWVIQNHINSFLADVEEANNHNRVTSGPTVKLVGNVHLSDVEIIYV